MNPLTLTSPSTPTEVRATRKYDGNPRGKKKKKKILKLLATRYYSRVTRWISKITLWSVPMVNVIDRDGA